MFESFYGMSANPFRMSADERYRYAHRTYIKAWSYLKYALEQAEGFVLITGRPGTGKTTLVRDILSELDNEQVEPVNLVTNRLQGEELLRLVALEFGYPAQEFNKATLLTRIEQHAIELHRLGRRILVIVDEAQNLSAHGLEELRLLSNLQVGSQSLFQIVLIGQEELRGLIYGQGIENVQQRIVTTCRLDPMAPEQVQGYLEHRLGIVGWQEDPRFEPAIFPLLHRITHGVPREINLVAARLLLYGALEQKHALNEADLLVVLSELAQEKRLTLDQAAILEELQESAHPRETPDGGEPQSVTTSRSAPVDPVPSKPASPPAEPEEPLPLSADREPSVDELPPMSVTPEEDRNPQGLFTDVDELLAGEDRFRQGMRRHWRWFFYPMAVALLLIIYWVPIPIDPTQNGSAPSQPVAERDGQGLAGKDEKVIDGSPKVEAPATESNDATTSALSELPGTLQREQGQTSADPNPNPQQEELGSFEQAPPLAAEQPVSVEPLPKVQKQETKNALPKQGVVAVSRDPLSSRSSMEEAADKPVAKQTEVAIETEEAAADKPMAKQTEVAIETEEAAADKPMAKQTEVAIETDKKYFLNFETPNDTLDDPSELRLARLTAWLHANPSMVIVITGILESGHEPLARMRQALQRAEQISARLQSKGISPRRIFVEGGQQNNTPEGFSVSVRITL